MKQEVPFMSTTMPKAQNITRKWYVIDAADKPLGRTAAKAADLLRGKTKVTYTPNADCGANVIIINAGQAVLTGKKPEQKIYRTHSGWIGGLKETKYRILMQEKPETAMRVAVRGMMPRNTVCKDSLKRLHIYADANYEQQAQKPIVLEIGGVRECISLRSLICMAPAAVSPLWPASICSPTAPAPSPSMAVTLTSTLAWRP